ncbi:MAG: hypothetical protein JNJ71_06585 [Rubrivivax sp.]|nr:hypothetical protein [Rubrivivax sp.]
MSQNLRRSAVLKALGPPPQPDPKVPLLRYPHLGLSFALPNEDTGNKGWGRDPPVLWMQVAPPSRAQTFGGLQIGQPQTLASEILTRDYKLTARVMGPGPGTAPVAMRVTDRDQRTMRELEVRFEGGAVSGLTFVTHDPAKSRDATRRTLFEMPPHLTIIAIVAGLAALVMTFIADRAGARRRWRIPGAIAGPLGAALLVVGLAAVGLSFGGLREGDPYGRMGNLMGVIFGIGFGFLGMVVMAQSSSRLFAWPARAVLALAIIATLLGQTGLLGR